MLKRLADQSAVDASKSHQMLAEVSPLLLLPAWHDHMETCWPDIVEIGPPARRLSPLWRAQNIAGVNSNSNHICKGLLSAGCTSSSSSWHWVRVGRAAPTASRQQMQDGGATQPANCT